MYLEDNKYYPYEFIKKYSKNLKDNGYMILLLDDNFFKNRELMDFKAEINEELKMQGIISLPKSLFKTRLKHIVIFQKISKGFIMNIRTKIYNIHFYTPLYL